MDLDPLNAFDTTIVFAMSIAVFKNFNNQIFLIKILMLLLGCFFIYLLLTSGPHSYNIFWLFLYPPSAFYLMGRPVALLFSGIFFSFALTIFLLQEQFSLAFKYDSEFKFVFLSSFFILSIISFALATAKRRYHQELAQKEKHLALEHQKLVEAKQNHSSNNSAKSEFLANMSHELRTPLNHMIGFTELVVDQKFGKLNPTQREYLNDALQSSKYLFALINDILDLKKMETGKLELEISEIDAKSLLENSITLIRERALNHGIQLSIDMDSVPVALRADQDKLTQVLYNLLSNAAKFTPDGGVVTVSAKTSERTCRRIRLNGGVEDRWIIQNPAESETSGKIEIRPCVEFRVTDSGIGIKNTDRERIFKRFEQADGSSRKRFQGTGLGLSLSKRYVELHGGRIWAESDGEGKGSTFKFVLPS